VSAEERGHVDREMARGLCAALEPVVTGEHSVLAFEAARNVAQLLVLGGLDRLLAVLAEHPGNRRSPEMRHALERLRRERDRSAASSSLVHFYEADRELAALASHLEGLEWTPRDTGRSPTEPAASTAGEPVIGLVDALGAARYVDARSEQTAREARLRAPVAAVLRAALDWMFGEGESMAPLRVTADGPTVELECRGVDPEGLLPAHEVVAAIGGSIGPVPGEGAWTIRVPAAAERDVFLMLEQDDLHLALPWSSVLRIQLETREDEPLTAPPLPPLKPLTGAPAGRPLVTVGLGLRRGSMAVDRLVWRLAADAFETDASPPAGATHAVRADDGEIFWVVDVVKLMRDVPLPPLPEARAPRGERPSIEPAAPEPAPPAELAAPTIESASPPAPAAAAHSAAPAWHGPMKLFLLTSDDVERIDTPGGSDAAVPPRLELEDAPPRLPLQAVLPVATPLAAPPTLAPGHGRRALIAEDSFMARIFLTRLLQTQGYDVHSVGTAAELRDAIAGGVWALLCVDVDLPDGRGAGLLREVSDSQIDRNEPAVVVALVRDWVDQEEAGRGGVHRTLLKPFAQKAVVALLERAGLPVTRPA
jgi:CheY-like chemotaxis protein